MRVGRRESHRLEMRVDEEQSRIKKRKNISSCWEEGRYSEEGE